MWGRRPPFCHSFKRNKMSQSIHKKILFDFFDGKATAIQRKHVEEWLRDSANEAFFFQCLDEWESLHPQYIPNASPALERFVALTKNAENQLVEQIPETEFEPTRSRRTWVWGIAASVVLLLSSGFLFQKNLFYESYRTGYAQTKSLYLADSTQVSLNANSTLWVPRWGFDDKREVLLEGEGEFKVTHTIDNKRFVVKTDREFNVEVLGTEFVVFARPRGNKVVLNKGKVEVHYQQKQLTLRPGDVLSLPANAVRPQLTKAAQPERQATWKNHQFYFDDAPLAEVRHTIEEHFGLRVTIADSGMNDRRLSGYFKASSAQEIADILSALLGTPVALSGDQLTISKPIQ